MAPEATDTEMVTCPQCGTAFLFGVRFCSSCGTALGEFEVERRSEPLLGGTMIGGYRVLALIGEGGMGRVYLAEHVKLGRRVALKVLRAELSSNSTSVARFFAEARAVNRISHPNIVEITDFLEQPGGAGCYIMELLDGEDLEMRMRRERLIPLPRVLHIAQQIASALGAVHDAGIIHRDLKPDNVFLIEHRGDPDFVKLVDFGVAKLSGASGAGIQMKATAVGQIIGTPEYMSPEQAGGQAVDHRTDIYSLGVVLYQMIAGHLPFEATTFGDLLVKHLTQDVALPPAQPGLPPGVKARRDQLLLDLLAKDPNFRPSSMTEVEQRLRAILDDSDAPASSKRMAIGSGTGMRPIQRRLGSVDRRRDVADPRTSPVERRSASADRRADDRDELKPHVRPPSADRKPADDERVGTGSGTHAALARPSSNAGTESGTHAALARPSSNVGTGSGTHAALARPSSNAEPDDLAIPTAGTEPEPPPIARKPSVDHPVPVGADGQLARLALQRRATPISGPVIERARKPASVDCRAEDVPVAPRTTSALELGVRFKPTGRATGEEAALVTAPVASAPVASAPVASAPVASAPVVPAVGAVATETAPIRRAASRSRTALVLAGGGAVVALAVVAFLLLRGGGRDERPVIAPAPAPVATPPLAKPAEVKIKFATAPSGAIVRLAGSREVLGTTPFTATLPRADRTATFEIEKAGYMTVSEDLRLDEDGAVATALPGIPAVTAPAPDRGAVERPAAKPAVPKKPARPPGQKPGHKPGHKPDKKPNLPF